MRPSAKIVGFVCLVVGLTAGVLAGFLVGHRRGQGHEEGGKPAENKPAENKPAEGGKPVEKENPEVSAFFNPASSLLLEFARGADGLSFVGGAKHTAGHDSLFDHRMSREYFVQSCKPTLDPKLQKAVSVHIRELDQKLIALAREKGVVVQERGDGHDVRQLDGGPQTLGPLAGKHLMIQDAREGFRYRYSTGRAHGVIQVQMDYLGKRGKGDDEVAVYYYEARVEEWSHARRP
jgi:hypothetical protein